MNYSVHNGDRELQFRGRLLGESTSQNGRKERWAEIQIYLTDGGNYIVAGIGRSTVPGEIDKKWAQVCEEPEAVIERLHLYDDNGGRYIPWVSQQALRLACDEDQRLTEAYLIEHVD